MTPSQGQSVPHRLCQCGCELPIEGCYTKTSSRYRQVKGFPIKFLPGHGKKKNKGPQYVIEDCGYKTPCWIWQWKKDRDGYGITRGNGTRRAHRHFYEQKYGKIPQGLLPDHLCKQKSCVNPDHIEAVPIIENNRRRCDIVLTYEKVAAIRRDAGVVPQKVLAARFGVSTTTISCVIRGRRWA